MGDAYLSTGTTLPYRVCGMLISSQPSDNTRWIYKRWKSNSIHYPCYSTSLKTKCSHHFILRYFNLWSSVRARSQHPNETVGRWLFFHFSLGEKNRTRVYTFL